MRQAARCALAILVIALVVAPGAGTEKTAPVSRRTPIVEAVQKTREAIVTVKADGRSDEAWSVLHRHAAYNRQVPGATTASRVP